MKAPKPAEIFQYALFAGLGFLAINGSIVIAKEDKERRQQKKETKRKEEAKKEARENVGFIINWVTPKGQKKQVNLDTLAGRLVEALTGQWYNEDEDTIKEVMFSIPGTTFTMKNGKKMYWHPIHIVAERYKIKSNRNLKNDLLKLLSPAEQAKTGANIHLKYL